MSAAVRLYNKIKEKHMSCCGVCGGQDTTKPTEQTNTPSEQATSDTTKHKGEEQAVPENEDE